MKPSTLVKRVEDIIEEMCMLTEKASSLGNPELNQKITKAAEHLLISHKLIKEAHKLFPAISIKGKRVQWLSLQVFRRDQYCCQVCGCQDMSASTLSRVRIIKEASKENIDDYITLCKEHKSEFAKLLPWDKRSSDMKECVEILKAMRAIYGN